MSRMDTSILDEQLNGLLQAPQLRLYYERIGAILEAEAVQRQAFYATVTEAMKAEFINGAMVVHSPVKMRHESASGRLYRLLATFVELYDLGYVAHEKLLITLTRNDYEPDICFFTQVRAAQFTPDQLQFPAPDFIVEVLSPSTEQTDRTIKFSDYAAHGVAEYWLVDPETEGVEQYLLQATGRYELLTKARTGQLSSSVVAGFEIPVRAIFATDSYLATLRQLIETAGDSS